MHDPARPARPHATAEAYLNRDSTTISHFQEKPLLLKDRLNTPSARQIARHRHEFLETFLSEFLPGSADGGSRPPIRPQPRRTRSASRGSSPR